MDLRLCFENKSGVSIDDEHVFQHYAENYLSGFTVEWAGSISISHRDKRTHGMQPLWQYVIRDASIACRDYLCEYLNRNPMCGYYVHVYERSPGHNAVKIY
ncbi:MAG: hypothetical protein H6842_00580 [Rhodospirillaceae bacterium]|nr:hypothetical protein [Rhodospirillaceae bacterium]